jgi:glycosyltransferase involved in cell wall biosynthesis
LPRQLSHVDRFIAPSRFTRDAHRARGLDLHFDVLPHFVPDRTRAESSSSPHERPYFLFVGRLVKMKGLQTLLPAFAGSSGPDLLVVGDGEYRADLQAMAAGKPRVRFLGSMPHDALSALYRHALAVVMPSIGYETFGLVLIEAYAERTPVIARDLGAMSEVVTESGGGLLFQTDAELRRALARFETDRAFREARGDAGHTAYRRLWSEEAHVHGYFDIIERARVARLARVTSHHEVSQAWPPQGPVTNGSHDGDA